MARPGQNSKRKARASAASSSHGSGEPTERVGGPVLPIAELPADFDGDPEDGATYLALVTREATTLPTYKRAANRPLPAAAAVAAAPAPAAAAASSSRHPALPTESWTVTFEAHFLAFRKHALESVEHRARPEGTPDPTSRSAWQTYVTGRRRGAQAAQELEDEYGDGDGDGDGGSADEGGMDVDAGDGDGGGDGDDNDDDEEAYVNSHVAPPPLPAPVEPEPDPAVLASLTSTEAALIIGHIAALLADRAAALAPPPAALLPAGTAAPAPAAAAPAPAAPAPVAPCPLTRPLARHLFALMLRLDAFLPSDALSTLRALARTCAELARWRWLAALPLAPVPAPRPADKAEADKADMADKSDRADGAAAAWPPAPAQAQAAGYEVGRGWKTVRDARARSDPVPPPEQGAGAADADALDDVLARCWLVAHAVVAGWAQRDLADEFARSFRRVPVA